MESLDQRLQETAEMRLVPQCADVESMESYVKECGSLHISMCIIW